MIGELGEVLQILKDRWAYLDNAAVSFGLATIPTEILEQKRHEVYRCHLAITNHFKLPAWEPVPRPGLGPSERGEENERLRAAFEIEEKRAGEYHPADREHLYDDHGANVQAVYDTGECDGIAWLADRLRKKMEGKCPSA